MFRMYFCSIFAIIRKLIDRRNYLDLNETQSGCCRFGVLITSALSPLPSVRPRFWESSALGAVAEAPASGWMGVGTLQLHVLTDLEFESCLFSLAFQRMVTVT